MTAAPVKTKIKVCSNTVRDSRTGVERDCDTPFKGERCPNFKSHVWPGPSGFCQGKFACEGTRSKSPSGKPLKTCEFWLNCPCTCHAEITEMFELTQRERTPVPNPEYIPYESKFKLPPYNDLEAAQPVNPTQAVSKIIKSQHPRVPDILVRDFDTSESANPRGLLAQNVLLACAHWVQQGADSECTTLWVQDYLQEELGMIAPSRGGISAVWSRWMEIGFGFISDNPVRFVCFTKSGVKYGLDALVKKNKRESKKETLNNFMQRG